MASRKPLPSSLDFEKSLDRLNQLVDKMEKGNLSLEESLKSFESGVTLIRHCQKTLKDAQQRVEILMKNQDSSVEQLLPYSTKDK